MPFSIALWNVSKSTLPADAIFPASSAVTPIWSASSDNAALVECGARALAAVGMQLKTAAGSTDANVAMAAGMSAAAFGVYRGGGAHRLDEWVDPDSLEVGLTALCRLLEELAAT